MNDGQANHVPAGWYDDGRGAIRWWNGVQWTQNVQPAYQPMSGYPAYAGMPQESERRRTSTSAKVVWIAGGSLVIIVVLAMVAAIGLPLIVSNTGPRATVRAFANDFLMAESCSDKVVEAFNSLTSENFRDGAMFTCDTVGVFGPNPAGFSITAGSVLAETATTATVTIVIRGSEFNENGTYPVMLIKEGGDWKIDSFAPAQAGASTPITPTRWAS